MVEHLVDVRERLSAVVEELDPEVLEGRLAARLVKEFAAIEKVAAAGKALAGRRVAASGAWRREGDRTPAHWMARTTGASVGHAVAALETARRLEALPATDHAFRSGKLSEVQAREITAAATADPQAEESLLRTAEEEGVAELRQACRRAAAVRDEVARHEAIRRSRYLRHFSDHDGAFRLDARLTPDAGAVVLAALAPHVEAAVEAARKSGRRDSHQACAADGLVAMARASAERRSAGAIRSSRPPAMVHVRVDHAAFVRGHTEAGETCEVPGVGPVPVATARALASDAVLSAIVSDGVDVRAVAHLGRTIPAHVRTALEARDLTCVVPRCVVGRALGDRPHRAPRRGRPHPPRQPRPPL